MYPIPGTWESSATDDPYNPTANPASLMLNVTRPLQEQFDSAACRRLHRSVRRAVLESDRVPAGRSGSRTTTVGPRAPRPRTTSWRKPHADCPLTSYVLAGFSQGAVIAGDVAARIGAGTGPGAGRPGARRRPHRRRSARSGDGAHEIGPPRRRCRRRSWRWTGSKLPGITMTGPRPGGFGALTDRTLSDLRAERRHLRRACRSVSIRNMPSSIASRSASTTDNPVHAHVQLVTSSTNRDHRDRSGWHELGGREDRRGTDSCARSESAAR